MASIYDPFDPRRRMAAQGRMPARGDGRLPTMEDYQNLAQAFREQQIQHKKLQATVQELQSQLDRQTAVMHEMEKEIQIKSDALHAQGEDLKKAEAELVWTNAALKQVEDQALQEESEDWQEEYLRLQAEVENLRKRWETRFQVESRSERNRILSDMLPLADHLDLALQHAANLSDSTTETFVENIQATQDAFAETLRRYGVERMEANQRPFDPSFHDAIGQMDSEEVPAGHVAHVIQAGYVDGNKVLRPAKVMVSREPDSGDSDFD